MKAIKVLVLGVIAIAIVAYGYTWWRVKTALDDGIRTVNMFAGIDYDSLLLSPTGTIHLGNLQIFPSVMGAQIPSISVKNIRVETPGLWYVMNFDAKSRDTELPEKFGVYFEDYVVEGSSGSTNMSGLPFEAFGCTFDNAFALPDQTEMGYPILRGNARLTYDLMTERTIRIGFGYEGAQIADTEFFVEISADIPLQSAFSGRSPRPYLQKAQWNWEDRGFNQQRNRYCAEKNDISEEAFITKHTEEVLKFLGRTSDVSPSRRLISQYRQLQQPEASAEFVVQPDSKLYLDQFMMFGLEEAWRLLNPQLGINNATPSEVQIRFGDYQPPARADGESEQEDFVNTPKPKENVPTPILRRWQRTDYDSLQNFVGKRIILHTITGEERVGVIEDWSPEELQLTVEVKGSGTAVIPIRKSQISYANVVR